MCTKRDLFLGAGAGCWGRHLNRVIDKVTAETQGPAQAGRNNNRQRSCACYEPGVSETAQVGVGKGAERHGPAVPSARPEPEVVHL